MRALTHFSLPIRGLKNGVHEYEFSVENDFFDQFEDSLIKKGKFDLRVEAIKKSDHIELNFQIDGELATDCDRCTASIQLPVEGDHKLIVKYTVDEESNDDEVWSITYDTPELVLNKAVYDFIVLSLPLVKVYDCELDDPVPCNDEARAYLDYEEEDEENETKGTLAEVLKNIDLN